MSEHAQYPTELYQYEELPAETSFRILELQPGREGDPISCMLHVVDRAEPSKIPPFGALSYAWGNPNAQASVICDGKLANITANLHSALVHFRHLDKPTFI
jgi:hypothetical protein